MSCSAGVVIAILTCTVPALLWPSPAQALISYYNCVLKPSNQWCDGRANGSFDALHSWDWNEGWYPGTWDGTVIACQRVWRPSDGTELAQSCAPDWTAASYGNQACACLEAEVKQVSAGPHSIQGYADTE